MCRSISLFLLAGCASHPGGSVPTAAAPPAAESPARMLTLEQGQALLAINPYRDPYRIRLTAPLNVAGASYWGMFKVCASAGGAISSIQAVRSTGVPELDLHWIRTMWSWSFDPYLEAGQATPFCFPMRMQVTSAP
jgi:hypothetical protein